jgi:hypothetical protein
LRQRAIDLAAHGDLRGMHVQLQLDRHSRLDESTLSRRSYGVVSAFKADACAPPVPRAA